MDPGGLRLIRGPFFKATLLLAPALACVLAPPARPREATRLWLFFLSMFFYLALAYVVNDHADREIDRLAGKRRWVARLSMPALVALGGACVLLSLTAIVAAVWRLAFGGIVLGGLLCGYAYSLPPFRIKEHGWLGVVFPAFFGKVVPVAAASACFGKIGWWLPVLALGELAKNAIDILFHQIDDYEPDRAARVRTFALGAGRELARKILRRLCLAGTVMAWFLLATVAWLVPEYRLYALAAAAGVLLLLLLGPGLFSRLPQTPLRAQIPWHYQLSGTAAFLLSPLILAAIAAGRDPLNLPLLAVMALSIIAQVFFYARYPSS